MNEEMNPALETKLILQPKVAKNIDCTRTVTVAVYTYFKSEQRDYIVAGKISVREKGPYTECGEIHNIISALRPFFAQTACSIAAGEQQWG